MANIFTESTNGYTRTSYELDMRTRHDEEYYKIRKEAFIKEVKEEGDIEQFKKDLTHLKLEETACLYCIPLIMVKFFKGQGI